MMNKTIFKKVIPQIILLMTLLGILLVVGCTSNPEKMLTYNFKQGTPELMVKPVENAPPALIYPDTQFKLILELDNQAAYDVTDGFVNILGLDEKYFQVVPNEQNIDPLLGRSLTTPSGDKQFLEFDGHAGKLAPGASQYVGNFFVTLRYNSKMEYLDTVCINPKLYEIYDTGCKVEPSKSTSGQGAPLKAAQVEEIISPGSRAEVEFRIKLTNGGQGRVGDVNLNSAKLGGEQLFCKFEGENPNQFIFSTGQQEATLICKKPLRDQNSYTSTLYIEFSYSYELTQQYKMELTSGQKQGTFY